MYTTNKPTILILYPDNHDFILVLTEKIFACSCTSTLHTLQEETYIPQIFIPKMNFNGNGCFVAKIHAHRLFYNGQTDMGKKMHESETWNFFSFCSCALTFYLLNLEM